MNRGLRTSVSCWKISFPFCVNSTGSTDTSHPPSLRPTLTPAARPMIWCPKHTPTMRMRSCLSSFSVNSTSFRIQGSLSNELCSSQHQSGTGTGTSPVLPVAALTRSADQNSVYIP